ncbi:protein MpDIR2 [Marchantia polymorpha subsp. ruderalis]|nr:hypothetical protein MARPO_0006s0217 [Marchantia polymorpha]BBN04760.1 hypothetical protein Mp_3g07430 [Marchantia polymorpha subsp. ruderalis]|eukprot:PTQ48205.1 hypothetical protein MARPO_0006s0217 [Marchantia polymorpha]
MERSAAAKVLGLVIALLCVVDLGQVAGRKAAEEIVLYVHESRVPPEPTLVTVVTATGNLSQIGFGTMQVFSNVLKDGASPSSATIGVEPGFVTIGKQNIFISYTFTLSTPSYNGTLAVQGAFALNVWPREFAVVGGTGKFRFANGYDVSEIVDDSNPANYVTVHRIFLKYL